MTNRAVVLPYPGDPFLLNYWLNLYEKVWADEITTLYVYLNSPIEENVVQYIRERVARAPHTKFFYADHQIEHGTVLKMSLDDVVEENVMFVEDDCYIWKSGLISECFEKIESGHFDIVGSKRGSCGMEILAAAADKWGISYEGLGDQGCNFWPNLFFCKTDILRKVDNMGARMWKAGETIEPLGIVAETDQCGDTFVEASLVLRNMVPAERILTIPQYHVHPMDEDAHDKGQSIWDGHAGWLHVGSLSSGVGGLLKDNFNRPLTMRTRMPENGATILGNAPTTDFERMEYERRVQWWWKFYDEREVGEITDFAVLYREAIERIINEFGLNRKNIMRRWLIYGEVYDF